MSYLALYRKYRPQSFEDFVGQREITKALQYQVKHSTYGHSYIFSGIRGTGKTSMAKVFAKAMNCENPQEGSPCNQCSSCIAMQKNAQMDVLEIDAASNNGVESIRELIENSYYLPAYSKVKVYIIDEVQMLSRGAFNALLKTLEEPSARVVFILATTEVHKIPDTIVSRCQQYAFQRISQQDMVKGMGTILQREGLSYDEDALELIGRHSGGAMRDAISALDRVLAYGPKHLGAKEVTTALGLLSSEEIHALLMCVFGEKPSQVMLSLQKITSTGKQVDTIVYDLMSFLRAVMVRRILGDHSQVSVLDVSSYAQSYSEIPLRKMENLLRDLEELSRALRFSLSPFMALEILLLQYATSENGEVEPVVEEVKEEILTEEEIWKGVLEKAKTQGMKIYVVLQEAKVSFQSSDELQVEFPKSKVSYDDFFKDKKELIENWIKEDTGKNISLKLYKNENSEEKQVEQFMGELGDTLIIR